MLIDCFTFFNELDVLEIRLHELEDVVDRFVLVEAPWTFQGNVKRFFFDKHSKRWARWIDRITTIRLGHPAPSGPWQAEDYSRNQIHHGLRHALAKPDDFVLISDVDEIPRALVLSAHNYADVPARLRGEQYYYKLDWKIPIGVHWNYPVLVRFSDLDVMTPNEWRHRHDIEPIENAGWHFSCLGDGAALERKLRAFAHAEIPEDVKDAVYLQDCIDSGSDLLGRFQCEPVEIDATYPHWVQDHRDELAHLTRAD